MAEQQNIAGGFGNLAAVNPHDSGEELQNTNQAIKDQLDALEARYSQPNWFKIAAGFAKPQLGGFVASLGSAAEAMGDTVEQQKKLAIPLAQMRSQLAVQDIQLKQRAKSDQIVSDWRKDHPGESVPASVVADANAYAETPASMAASKEIENNRAQQTLLMERQKAARERVNLAISMRQEPSPSDLVEAGMTPSAGSGTGGGGGGNLGGGNNTTPPVNPELSNSSNNSSSASVVAPTNSPSNVVNSGDFLSVIRKIENPTGKTGNVNSKDTAHGPAQINDPTLEKIHKNFPNTVEPSQYGGANDDANKAYEYALLAGNHGDLQNNGVSSTAINHRLAWHFGSPDAAKIIKADDSTPLSSIINKDVLKKNGIDENANVGFIKSQESSNLWKNNINPNSVLQFSGVQPTGASGTNGPSTLPSSTKVISNYYSPTQLGSMSTEQVNAAEAQAKERINNLAAFGSDENYAKNMAPVQSALGLVTGDKERAKRVLGLMQSNDYYTRAMRALQEGVGVHLGPYGASLNLPGKTWVNSGLSKDDQDYASALATQLAQIKLAQQNAANVNPNAANVGETQAAFASSPNMDMQPLSIAHSLLHIKAYYDMQHELHNYQSAVRSGQHKDYVLDKTVTPMTDTLNSEGFKKITGKYIGENVTQPDGSTQYVPGIHEGITENYLKHLNKKGEKNG